jgi:hypothetical protein
MTSNGGQSWTSLIRTPFDVHSLAIDPNNPGTLYIGTGSEFSVGNGIYKSADGGLSWKNVGLAGTSALDVAIDRAVSFILACTGGGNDGFLSVLNPSGGVLESSAYIGSSNSDSHAGIAGNGFINGGRSGAWVFRRRGFGSGFQLSSDISDRKGNNSGSK